MSNLFADFRWYLKMAQWDDYVMAALVTSIVWAPLLYLLFRYCVAQDVLSLAALFISSYCARPLLRNKRN